MTRTDINHLLYGACAAIVGGLVGAIWTTVAITHWGLFDLRVIQWGGIADWIIAGATIGLLVATAGLYFMARRQLSMQTLTQRQWATLRACDRYDSDMLLWEAKKALMQVAKGGRARQSNAELRQNCILLFNYFDSIVIGLQQGLYIESIVSEHLGRIMVDWRRTISGMDNLAVKEFVRDLPTDFVQFDRLETRLRGLILTTLGVTRQLPQAA